MSMHILIPKQRIVQLQELAPSTFTTSVLSKLLLRVRVRRLGLGSAAPRVGPDRCKIIIKRPNLGFNPHRKLSSVVHPPSWGPSASVRINQCDTGHFQTWPGAWVVPSGSQFGPSDGAAEHASRRAWAPVSGRRRPLARRHQVACGLRSGPRPPSNARIARPGARPGLPHRVARRKGCERLPVSCEVRSGAASPAPPDGSAEVRPPVATPRGQYRSRSPPPPPLGV